MFGICRSIALKLQGVVKNIHVSEFGSFRVIAAMTVIISTKGTPQAISLEGEIFQNIIQEKQSLPEPS